MNIAAKRVHGMFSILDRLAKRSKTRPASLAPASIFIQGRAAIGSVEVNND